MLAFVTVGSTRFDGLVQAVLSDDVRSALVDQGYTRLVVQCGESSAPIDIQDLQLDISIWKFKPSLEDDYRSADLIISHAGSGTILSVLRLPRPPPLIVVPNPTLADNHQEELAYALSQLGHLAFCDVRSIADTITSLDTKIIVPFPAFEANKFSDILDKAMGFS